MATTSVVNVDGARVAYRAHGRGPAVVLVNGTAALDAQIVMDAAKLYPICRWIPSE